MQGDLDQLGLAEPRAKCAREPSGESPWPKLDFAALVAGQSTLWLWIAFRARGSRCRLVTFKRERQMARIPYCRHFDSRRAQNLHGQTHERVASK